MSKISLRLTLVVLVAYVSLAAPVYAAPKNAREAMREARGELRQARREFREQIEATRSELRQERKGILEELRHKLSSPAGFLRKLLGKRAVIVRGAVSAISGTSLTVDKDGSSYSVLTGTFERCTTRIRRRFWGVSSFSEVGIGDQVNVVGFFQDEARTIIEACLIRDLSVQRRHGVFVGKVVSLTATGWVLDPVGDRPNQTIVVSPITKYVNRRNDPIDQGDVIVSHRVRVKGLWNMISNTITEVIHVKDYSLPPLATPSATPTP